AGLPATFSRSRPLRLMTCGARLAATSTMTNTPAQRSRSPLHGLRHERMWRGGILKTHPCLAGAWGGGTGPGGAERLVLALRRLPPWVCRSGLAGAGMQLLGADFLPVGRDHC